MRIVVRVHRSFRRRPVLAHLYDSLRDCRGLSYVERYRSLSGADCPPLRSRFLRLSTLQVEVPHPDGSGAGAPADCPPECALDERAAGSSRLQRRYDSQILCQIVCHASSRPRGRAMRTGNSLRSRGWHVVCSSRTTMMRYLLVLAATALPSACANAVRTGAIDEQKDSSALVKAYDGSGAQREAGHARVTDAAASRSSHVSFPVPDGQPGCAQVESAFEAWIRAVFSRNA